MVKLRLLKLKNNRKYVIIIHKDEEFYMKKKFNIFVLLLIIMMMVILPSCKKDEENELKDDKIVTIYSVNDFQGAIKEIELYFSFFLTGRMYLKYRSGWK